MEIVFLGTGGGRTVLVRQDRWTGGFRINSDSANIHVDPGPGALTHSHQLGQDPLKLDAVVITHYHIDHCSDASVICEGMTEYALKKKGILIGSRYAIEGDSNNDRGIDKYHQSKINEIYIAKIGDKKLFKTKTGEFSIEPIKTVHDEPTCFGFKLHLDGKIIGYTSDTEFYPEMPNNYSGCDFLILNCLRPVEDGIPDHLKTEDVIKILKTAKPKIAILTHMGEKFLKSNPETQAELISNKTGVKCIAAKDGMKINQNFNISQ